MGGEFRPSQNTASKQALAAIVKKAPARFRFPVELRSGAQNRCATSCTTCLVSRRNGATAQ
jgi:hypothetical protein